MSKSDNERIAKAEARLDQAEKVLDKVASSLELLVKIKEASTSHSQRLTKIEQRQDQIRTELAKWAGFRMIGFWVLGLVGSAAVSVIVRVLTL